MTTDTLSLDLLAAHAVGDFPLQSDRMTAEKIDNPRTRAEHVTAYSIPFALALRRSGWSVKQRVTFLAANWIVHYAIDSRRWAEPRKGFEARPIWFDQAFHVITLAVLSNLIGNDC